MTTTNLGREAHTRKFLFIMLIEKEAAAMLGCTVSALRKWRMFGRGPRWCKLGRLVRYSVADLEAFIEAHTVEAK